MSAGMSPHVVVISQDGGAFRCLHCGERHVPRLPMPCEAHVAACRGFVLMHKHCAKPVPPSKQVELFDALARKEAEASVALDKHPDTSTHVLEDDPPEHDQPELRTYAEFETGHYEKFAQTYPAPKTQHGLGRLLHEVLSAEQRAAFKKGTLGTWHPSSADFQDIAHWARVAKARADSMASAQRGEPGEGGITIPLLPPMPLELMKALGVVPRWTKAKKKSARKAKARK